VNAVVAWFGPTDMTTNDWPKNVIGLISNLVGGPKEEKVEACRKASPLFYVNAGDAPMLLIHGTKDRLVPWSQATAMADALSKAGVYGRVDLIVGADHGWGGPELQRTVDETQAFFVERLKARK
jgi:dipeptidyl aminopeptidase/acylaminoacyl peptidase